MDTCRFLWFDGWGLMVGSSAARVFNYPKMSSGCG